MLLSNRKGNDMANIESGMQLIDIYATDINFHRNDEFSRDGSASYEPEIGFRIGEINDDGIFHARLKYEIIEAPEAFPFQLSAEVEGKFIFTDKNMAKDMEKFFPNVLAILFPFIRALVTQVTGSAGFQPLIVPLVNTLELTKDLKNETIGEKECDV